jgi:hypothetical protein
MEGMSRLFVRLGDGLLAALVPGLKAAAADCFNEFLGCVTCPNGYIACCYRFCCVVNGNLECTNLCGEDPCA